ncbi:MAG: SH3 domain-containing protein [Lachnospiraceae bacterium]|nr:SH3 domain-containing protein [Lachnospiraceae bacterium]
MKYKEYMSKIMVFLLAITLLAGSAGRYPVQAASEAKGVIAAGALYMREGPGTDYANILLDGEKVLLEHGHEVTILGERDGWYHIRTVVDGEVVEGYSLSAKDSVVYITVSEGEIFDETQILGKITATSLNLRQGPSTDHGKVAFGEGTVKFTKGQEVLILGEKDGWYHVKADYEGSTVEGFCLGDYVELTWGEKSDIPSDSGELIGDGDGGSGDKQDPKDTDGSDTGKTGDKDTGDKDNSKDNDKDKDNNKDNNKDKDKDDKSGADDEQKEFDPTDLSNGVPEGYEITTLNWAASLNYKGTVSSQTGLNMRKSASTTAKVVAVLEYGQEVQIIKSKVYTTKDDQGKEVKTRWYRVVANTGGEYVAGYVVSDYVTIDCSDDVVATTKKSKLVLRSKAKDGARRVRTSDGTVIRFAKGTVIEILEDVIGKDGLRYFKISAEYKGTEYVGYIPALTMTFVSNATGYTAQILTPIPEPAKVEEVKSEDPEPVKTPTDSFEGANARIAGAAGLAVSKEPKGSGERLFTEDKKLILLYSQDPIEVLSVENGTDDGSQSWCYIRFYFDGTEYFGYIRSGYVEAYSSLTLLETTESASAANVDFETKLEQENFPESYKAALRELHAQYPSWEFKAFHTGLDWNEVIAAETEVGVNLLPVSYSAEWKSFEPGAYSWKTDTWTVFDSTYWVTASKEAVEYYMDPRNFLDYNTVFQFEVLSYKPEYQDWAGVANILKNTAMSGNSYEFTDSLGNTRTISFEDTFLMAAEYTGVSPFHLASRAKQEVTLGVDKMSNSVTGTVEGYEGLYNYYNIGAYHSTVPGENIKHGLQFANGGTSNINVLIPWTDPFRSIVGGAFYIGNNYINRGQNTIYLQKFNVTNGGMYSHQYMANVEAPYSEGIRCYRGYVDPDQIPIVFSIPVYLNMPESACPKPEKKYNPNNWLKTLKIYNKDGDKLALTPTFDYTSDQEYSLIVDSSTDYLKIKASTVSTLAKIAGDGAVNPDTGLNRFVVSVEAENGDIREYVINMIREEAPETPPESADEDTSGDTETPVDTQEPENIETPVESQESENTETPVETQVPENTEIPVETQETENAGTTENTEISGSPEGTAEDGSIPDAGVNGESGTAVPAQDTPDGDTSSDNGNSGNETADGDSGNADDNTVPDDIPIVTDVTGG